MFILPATLAFKLLTDEGTVLTVMIYADPDDVMWWVTLESTLSIDDLIQLQVNYLLHPLKKILL